MTAATDVSSDFIAAGIGPISVLPLFER